MDSSIAKWVYRHFSQSCCPFNIKFAQELKEPAFKPRAFIANKDAQTLARDLLAMEQADFSAAFRKSPMKRAKLAGLQRNPRVLNGNRQCPPPPARPGMDGERDMTCAPLDAGAPGT